MDEFDLKRQRALQRMACTARRGWSSWEAYAADRRRSVNLLTRATARMLRSHVSRAVSAWIYARDARTAHLKLLRTSVGFLSNHKLSRAWTSWRTLPATNYQSISRTKIRPRRLLHTSVTQQLNPNGSKKAP